MKNIAKLISITFFLSIGNSVYSQKQNSELDSLLKLVENKKIDTASVNIYNKIALILSEISPDSAIVYSEQTLIAAEKLNYENGVAHSYFVLGKSYYKKGEYEKALDNLFNSLKTAESQLQKNDLQILYSTLAEIYLKLDDYPKAVDFFTSALSTLEENDLSHEKGKILLNLATAYQKSDSTEKAVFYYEMSLKLNTLYSDSANIALCYIGLGVNNFKLGSFRKAIQNYLTAAEWLEKTHQNILLTDVNLYLAETYSKIGFPSKSEIYFNKAMQSAIAADSDEILMKVFENKYKHYEKAGNFTKAFFALKNYYLLKDTLNVRKVAEEISLLKKEQKSEINKKDEEVKRALLSEQQAFFREQEYSGYLILFFTLAVPLLLFLTVVLIFQRQKAHIKLTQKDSEIFKQKNEILNAKGKIQLQNQEIELIVSEKQNLNSEINLIKQKIEQNKILFSETISHISDVNKILSKTQNILSETQNNFFVFTEKSDLRQNFEFKIFKNNNKLIFISNQKISFPDFSFITNISDFSLSFCGKNFSCWIINENKNIQPKIFKTQTEYNQTFKTKILSNDTLFFINSETFNFSDIQNILSNYISGNFGNKNVEKVINLSDIIPATSDKISIPENLTIIAFKI